MTSTTTPSTEAPNVEGVQVGDFLVSSWGYDETHADFYKVVGLTAKRIKIQKWSKVTTENGSPSRVAMPGEGPAQGAWVNGTYDRTVTAPVETKKVVVWKDGTRTAKWVTISTYEFAHLWDGTPAYETGAQWGR